MTLPMILKEYYEYTEEIPVCQNLSWTFNGERHHFYACNLNDVPEDAILTRELFNAEDFLNAVRLGMILADAGYTNLDVQKEIIDAAREE